MAKLSDDRRGVLELLAGSQRGCSEAILMAHGFPMSLVDELVRDGLATAAPLKARIGGRLVEVRRVMITEVGLKALARSGGT
jgi:hypothetical protein